MKKLSLLLVLLFICSGFSFAQNEVLREQSSLIGITEFGVVVNVETPVDFEEKSLNVATLKRQILENFKDLPVSIINERRLQRSDEYPIFYLHLNIMRASNNTYPFSIEMNFYQPVKLVLNRDMQTMASTWNSGQVGIVSEDLLSIISTEVVQATDAFKENFQKMN
ncbi:MAG: hypothetical protein RLN81_11050 [Balneolaceae bacterium]